MTLGDDLHAYAVRKSLAERHDLAFHIVECDRLPGSRGLSWSTDPGAAPTLPALGGDLLDVRALDVVWWRRVHGPPKVPEGLDEAHRDLIANDTWAALGGMLSNSFGGRWINEPRATRHGENKLVQLKAAAEAGWRVPATLVSQDPARVREFCDVLSGQVIVKAVRGTTKRHLLAQVISPEMLEAEESIALAPAIYQELVPGRRHIRAHCFGERVLAALIVSNDLDWRGSPDLRVSETELPPEVETRLRSVLRALGLRMGVFDLKLTDEGEYVWLEVNPQGQFLFIEGLCGMALSDAFADFLAEEAAQVRGLG